MAVPYPGNCVAHYVASDAVVVKSAASSVPTAFIPAKNRGSVFSGTQRLTKAAPITALADSKEITIAGTFRLDSLTGIQVILVQQNLSSTSATNYAFSMYWHTTILTVILNDGAANALGQTRYTPSGAIVAGVTYAYVWAINLATGVSTLRIDDVDRTTTWSIAAVDSEIGFTTASAAPYVVGALSNGAGPLSGIIGNVFLTNQFIDPTTNWGLFFDANNVPIDSTVETSPGVYTFQSAEAQTVAPSLNLREDDTTPSDPDSLALNTRASAGALTVTGTLTKYAGPSLVQATEADMPVSTINLASPNITNDYAVAANNTRESGISDPFGGTSAHRVTQTGGGSTLYFYDQLPATRTGDTIKAGMWLRIESGSSSNITITKGSGASGAPVVPNGTWAFYSVPAIAIVDGAVANWSGCNISSATDLVIDVFLPQYSITTGQADTDEMPPFVAYGAAPRSLVFDGVSDFMNTTIAGLEQPTTVYFRGKQITHSSGDSIIDGITSNTNRIQQWGASPNFRLYAGSSGPENADAALNTFAIICTVASGANSIAQVDAGAPTTGDAGLGDMGGLTVGTNGGGGVTYSNIEVTDILIYDIALSALQRSAVYNFMARSARYNTGSLFDNFIG